MQKAIGFIACVSVMAASLFYFSGGDPSQMLSAQTESSDAEAFGPVARKLMDKARQLAQQGKTAEARREAETAAAMFSNWNEGEQTPKQFLSELGEQSGEDLSLFDNADWSGDADNPFAGEGVEENPFAESDEASAASADASAAEVKRFKARRLMKEANEALAARDFEVARSRAMQARALDAAWDIWDVTPEQMLTQIDNADGAKTFLANEATQVADSADDNFARAQQLIA